MAEPLMKIDLISPEGERHSVVVHPFTVAEASRTSGAIDRETGEPTIYGGYLISWIAARKSLGVDAVPSLEDFINTWKLPDPSDKPESVDDAAGESLAP